MTKHFPTSFSRLGNNREKEKWDFKNTNAVTKNVRRNTNMGFVLDCLQITSLCYKSTISSYSYLHSQKTTWNYLKEATWIAVVERRTTMDLGLALRKTKVVEWSANMETVLSFCIIRPAYAPNITTLLAAVDFSLNEHCFVNHNRRLEWTATSPIPMLNNAVCNVPWWNLHETQ